MKAYLKIRWEDGGEPLGPVSLLLQHTHQMGMGIADGWVVKRHKEHDVGIINTPKQHMKKLIQKRCVDARAQACNELRSEAAECGAIDTAGQQVQEAKGKLR